MRGRNALGGILVAALIAQPAAATAKQGGGEVTKLAAQRCKQERQELGRTGFRKRYGARNQMRNCIKRTRSRARAASQTAATACEAELAQIGSARFIEEYGSDETGFDAMEECIAEGIDELLDHGDHEEEDDGSEEE